MEKLFEQMEIVRQSGRTNMLDWRGVLHASRALNCPDLEAWFSDHVPNEYGRMVMVDFNDWKKRQSVAS